jgi:hypothetical protein
MSFTNHLNYAYRNDIAQLEPYLLKTKEILESLSRGGSFHYAPGLVFLEEELSREMYQIQTGAGFGDLPVSAIVRVR